MTDEKGIVEEKSLEEIAREKFGEKLDVWKAQYAPKQLIVIAVEDKMIVLKPMTPAVLSRYTMMLGSEGMAEATRYALNELTLGGDAEVIDDDDYFMSAFMQFNAVVELKKGRASKL